MKKMLRVPYFYEEELILKGHTNSKMFLNNDYCNVLISHIDSNDIQHVGCLEREGKTPNDFFEYDGSIYTICSFSGIEKKLNTMERKLYKDEKNSDNIKELFNIFSSITPTFFEKISKYLKYNQSEVKSHISNNKVEAQTEINKFFSNFIISEHNGKDILLKKTPGPFFLMNMSNCIDDKSNDVLFYLLEKHKYVNNLTKNRTEVSFEKNKKHRNFLKNKTLNYLPGCLIDKFLKDENVENFENGFILKNNSGTLTIKNRNLFLSQLNVEVFLGNIIANNLIPNEIHNEFKEKKQEKRYYHIEDKKIINDLTEEEIIAYGSLLQARKNILKSDYNDISIKLAIDSLDEYIEAIPHKESLIEKIKERQNELNNFYDILTSQELNLNNNFSLNNF